MDLCCSQMQPVLTAVRSDNKRGTPQFTAFASVFMLCSQLTPSFLFQHWFWFEDHIIILCCIAIFLYLTSKILLQPAVISFVDRNVDRKSLLHRLFGDRNGDIESLVRYMQSTFCNWVSMIFTVKQRPGQTTGMSYRSMFYLTQQCQAYNVPFISIVYFNTYQEDRKLVINVEESMRFHYKLM